MTLNEIILDLKKEFKENDSLKIRRFCVGDKNLALVFLESFADFDIISKDIILPIINFQNNKSENFGEKSKNKIEAKSENLNNIKEIKNENFNNKSDQESEELNSEDSQENKKLRKGNERKNEKINKKSEKSFVNFIAKNILPASEISVSENKNEWISKICRGEKVLFVDGEESGIIINSKNLFKRAIIEPPNNNIIRGPREGFNEDINTNLNLLRKRLVTNDLKIETMEIGRITKTKVAITYLTKIASKGVVKKIKENLQKIDIDGILDSYYLQDYLEDRPNSIFKQVGWTEKPDILAGKILEGRVGIIVDGSPIALTLPFLLVEDLQSADDYYQENNAVTFVRLLRFFGLFIALTMPGIYIALQLYHYKALPLKFLVTIINSSQNIPMPPSIEVLFAFFMFEILYEASVRTPKSLGSSFNIIGALILGDTAVKSNLASAPTIMIVALSSIAIYLIPDATNVMRLLRFFITLLATIIGVVGICVGLIFIVAYLSDFDSYGADYLSPFAPYKTGDFKDSFFKANILSMKQRPKSFLQKNKTRSVINDEKK